MIEDPFTGRRLCYRPSGYSYVLYSFGPDLTDDGGLPLLDDQDSNRGDIGICPCRRTPSYTRPPHRYVAVPHMMVPKQPARE